MNISFADRGLNKKKNKVVLNINSPYNFKNSLNFNLRNGLKYTGSLSTHSVTPTTAIPTTFKYLITYQKGNSVYILPYKQRIVSADIRPGYAGAKLVISVH